MRACGGKKGEYQTGQVLLEMRRKGVWREEDRVGQRTTVGPMKYHTYCGVLRYLS